MAVSSAGKWSQIRPPSAASATLPSDRPRDQALAARRGRQAARPSAPRARHLAAREPRDAELLADVRSTPRARRSAGAGAPPARAIFAQRAGATDRAPAAERVHACDQAFRLGPEDDRARPGASRWTAAREQRTSGRRHAGRSGARATTARCGRGPAARSSRRRGPRATPGSRSGTAMWPQGVAHGGRTRRRPRPRRRDGRGGTGPTGPWRDRRPHGRRLGRRRGRRSRRRSRRGPRVFLVERRGLLECSDPARARRGPAAARPQSRACFGR